MSMRELPFLRWLRSRTPRDRDVLLGPGDDCAAVRIHGRSLLLKTDMVIEGVHFKSGTPLRLVGRKGMARNLSDAAAMGCPARFALVAAALPRRFTERDARTLHAGLATIARRFGVAIVGGDTAVHDGPLTVTVSLIALPGRLRPVPRSGARPGDAVFVTGTFGGSILGKHMTFAPRLREGIALNRAFRVRAMIDVSDGLARDLGHVCEASGVGAVLHAAAIPVSAAARQLARRTGRSPLDHALRDGEDYELLFVLDPGDAERLERRPPFRTRVTRIGSIAKGSQLKLREANGSEAELSPTGYEHGETTNIHPPTTDKEPTKANGS